MSWKQTSKKRILACELNLHLGISMTWKLAFNAGTSLNYCVLDQIVNQM